jgi:hypothetical protein
MHALPLAFSSCSPPQQASGQLTVGTPDANGKIANSIGSVRFDVHVGNPQTPANEADVNVKASITDVRNQSDLSDYTGELLVEPLVQITDRASGPSASDPATVESFPFPFEVPCAATSNTNVGGTCSVVSSFNAIMPAVVTEGKRAIWALNAVDLFDAGADGQVTTENDNTLFAQQGLFVP